MWSCNSLSLLFLYLDRNSHWLHIYHVLGTAESSACVLLIRLYGHSVRQMLLPFPFTEEKTEAPRGQGTNSGTRLISVSEDQLHNLQRPVRRENVGSLFKVIKN